MLPLALTLLGCAPPEPVAFCDNPALRYDYAPDPSDGFTTFPDDRWTTPDATTETGLRVAMDLERMPGLAGFPENYLDWFDQLSTLDGWGTTAGIILRFTAPLPALPDAEQVVLAALTPDGPVTYAPERLLTDGGTTLLLRPRVALPPATRVVALLLTDPEEAGCVNPGGATARLLDPAAEGADPDDPWAARWQEDLAALGIAPERVGAMTTFTTQSTTAQSVAVAADVATHDYRLEDLACQDTGPQRTCSATVEVFDYRGDDRLVPPGDVEPRGSYTLPVRLWLPTADHPGPWPVLLCGHGLGGDRDQCRATQPHTAEAGVAVVAVDAVEHGDHPLPTEAPLELMQPLMIFALRLDPPGISGLQLRDNFRQSAWDKLQVLAAVRAGLDVDGDGASDLDPTRVGYVGVSLGAIMGPELLALDPDLAGGWLVAGAGRVTQIIQDSPSFSVLIDLMKPSHYDDGDIHRAFPLLQTMVDGGDPMVYAPHVQGPRLVEGRTPDLYVAAALNDDVVPNSTNELLALGLGVPGVGEEIWPIEGVTFTPGDVSANLPGGRTGGFVQFSRVNERGEERAAEHANMHDSDQGIEAMSGFFLPLFDGEPAVVVDPEVQ